MEVEVLLGKHTRFTRYDVVVSVPTSDSSVAELIVQIRQQLAPPLKRVIQESERSGARLFLALAPNGPERPDESKCLRDYQLTGGRCKLWLMCSYENHPDNTI